MFSGGFEVEIGGEGIAPAAVVAAKPVDGFGDGGLGGGEAFEDLMDRVGDNGPEFFFGRVVRVGGDEDDFVVFR